MIRYTKYSFDIINDSVHKEPQVPKFVENDEISIKYVMEPKWSQHWWDFCI